MEQQKSENRAHIVNHHFKDVDKKAYMLCVNDLKDFLIHTPMISVTDLAFELGISIDGLKLWLKPLLEDGTVFVVLKDGQQFVKLNIKSSDRFKRLGTTLNKERLHRRAGKATLQRLKKKKFTKSSQTLLDIIEKHGAVTAAELAEVLNIDVELVKKWAHDLERYGMLEIDFEGDDLLIRPH